MPIRTQGEVPNESGVHKYGAQVVPMGQLSRRRLPRAEEYPDRPPAVSVRRQLRVIGHAQAGTTDLAGWRRPVLPTGP